VEHPNRIPSFAKSTKDGPRVGKFLEFLVVVAVAVTPGPVFFLFTGRQMAEIAVRVAVIFDGPLIVVNDLIVIPDVIVVVVGVVDPVVMMRAGHSKHGTGQGGG
jgi:hypothetical protein